MKKVSVIIPSYGSNTDPCRAIESVFNQSYADVEVVVVDDNGKGTIQQKKNEETFKKYANDYRFKYVVHDINQGGAVARNNGVKECSGSYLCFLDDDDFLSDKEKITKQIEIDATLDDSWAGTYSSLHKYLGDKLIRKVEAKYSGFIVEDFMKGNTSIGTAAPIIRKKCFEAIGGFDGSFKRHQDWEFFARLTDLFQLKAVPEVFYDRCYKTDVPKRSIESRIEYMNKYTTKMKKCIKKVPKEKLNKIMREKYISIVFALIKQRRLKEAKLVMKDNSFEFADYGTMIKSIFSYIANRIRYGSHF